MATCFEGRTVFEEFGDLTDPKPSLFGTDDVNALCNMNPAQLGKQKKILIEKIDASENYIELQMVIWRALALMQPSKQPEDVQSAEEKKVDAAVEEDDETQSIPITVDIEGWLPGWDCYSRRKKAMNGLCPTGHYLFLEMHSELETTSSNGMQFVCSLYTLFMCTALCSAAEKCEQCGGEAELAVCVACSDQKAPSKLLGTDAWGGRMLDYEEPVCFCFECRCGNFYRSKEQRETDELKGRLFRDEMVKNPALSLDLLTDLPRKAGLDRLLSDIAKSDAPQTFALFLVDVDNLKALNSTLGHEGADEIIKQIGAILKKEADQVNVQTSCWTWNFTRCWCFRFVLVIIVCTCAIVYIRVYSQGGDELAIVLETVVTGNSRISVQREYTPMNLMKRSLQRFYEGFHKQINCLTGGKVEQLDIEEGSSC